MWREALVQGGGYHGRRGDQVTFPVFWFLYRGLGLWPCRVSTNPKGRNRTPIVVCATIDNNKDKTRNIIRLTRVYDGPGTLLSI